MPFKHTHLTKLLATSIIILLTTTLTYSQAILKGKVTDAATGEPMTGANITINNQQQTVLLDGTYTFKNIKPGTYNIQINYVAYKSIQQTIQISNTIIKNFQLQPIVNELTAVTIQSGKVSNETQARNLEKNSDQLVNILSAKTIQLLPDITVANIMQRVPGVIIDRSNTGEGRYPVIRGMDKRYNTTLVNGIKIPSPDNNSRYVPLDLFPAELLERLEVSKSLTPSMEGDAIGGTVNLVMKDAPQHLLVQANASAGYSTILNDQPFMAFDHSAVSKQSPAEIHGPDYNATGKDFTSRNLDFSKLNNPVNKTFGLTLGNRFGAKKQLGAVISASYQDIYRGTNSSYFFPNVQPGLNNTPVFSDIYSRQYSTESKRLGLYGNFDFLIKPGQKITWFNMYLRTDDYQSRSTVDSVLAISRTGPGNGNVNIENRSTTQTQQIFNSTLKGTHTISDLFTADWSAVFSAAKNQVPDYAVYSTQHQVTTNATTGAVTETPGFLTTMTRIWSHNTDKDASFYGNLTFTPQIFGRKAEFKAGGLYRHKNRDNYYNEYDLVASLSPNSNQQFFNGIDNAQFGFKGSDGGKTGEFNANTYSVDEDISAGYLQGKVSLTEKLEVLGGLRVEHTFDHYETVQPNTVAGKSGTIHYNDILPSLQFKYSITNNQALRLDYYKAISRPGYFELVPTLVIGEYYNEAGNYNLNRSRANNLDFRYELFPGGADQLLIGTFYKQIFDPIELGVEKANGTNTTQVLEPFNFGTATNFGAEVAATRYFGKFGIAANYTYTHSRITTDKLYYFRNDAGTITNETRSETRPLQGQADHAGNVSFIYKDPKSGLDLQIAYVYTGERIVVLSPYYGLDYWQRPLSQLDFSAEKRIKQHFSVYTKITNITNSATKVYLKQPNNFLSGRDILPQQDQADKILVQNIFYKPSFLVGVRYKFN